jgi:hypothetical protein
MATPTRKAATPADDINPSASDSTSCYTGYPQLGDAHTPEDVIAGHLHWLTANADHWLAGNSDGLKPSLAMFSDAVLKSATQLAALNRQGVPDPLGDLDVAIGAAQEEADSLLANLQ